MIEADAVVRTSSATSAASRWRTCGCAEYGRPRVVFPRTPITLPLPAAPMPGRQTVIYARPLPENPTRRRKQRQLESFARRTAQTALERLEGRDCTHPNPWSRFEGQLFCPVCDRLKTDVNVCRHCGLVMCYSCRRNRPRDGDYGS